MSEASAAGSSPGMPVVSAAGQSTGMGDVDAVSAIITCSERHVRRMSDSGQMPRPVHVGRLVRWRLRTGNPMTGVLDWIEAGCPTCRPATCWKTGSAPP